jgi:coatomer subunit beta'
MPLRLSIKKKLQNRSERVKCVEIHPTEPWVLSALYSGNVFIWNYDSQTLVKQFEVVEANTPVRCAKFIARQQWFVCGSDDYHVRCFNYNTGEKVTAFEAHTDYIRCVEVHPTHPYVLTSSDDMSIKLWDWSKGWQNTQIFEGHSHYVMQVKFNPKDTNTFASASLDHMVKVWGIGSSTPHFTLEGHTKGVNCVDYYPGADKPYLLSGADDATVNIWDYQTKALVNTLEGHSANITSVAFHQKLPVIVSASEDDTVRVWHSSTYRLETTLNYQWDRAWTVGVSNNSNKIAIGYDQGTMVVKLGKERPLVSMDVKTGKFIWTRNNDVLTSSVRGTGDKTTDGERVFLPGGAKDLGSVELYPQSVQHNVNGRFVAICGDGEYIIYTATALRNKSFGSALDFVWANEGKGDYAIRESSSRIKTFKNFKEAETFRPLGMQAEGLHGGAMIGVRGSDCIAFHRWEDGAFVARIDIEDPKNVYWSGSGDLVTIACVESFYVLKYNVDAVNEAMAQGDIPEDGVEDAFELAYDVNERVRSGQWVGDCFLYTNRANRLNYSVGGEVLTLSHLDEKMYVLGFLPRENRVYLCNKGLDVYSYALLTSVLNYQTAILRKDFDEANELLPAIPEEHLDAISTFLESQGYKEQALTVARDSDQRFSLALQLGKLEKAQEIMVEIEAADDVDVQLKWKQLGDLALMNGNLNLSIQCATKAKDLGGLLLLHSSTGNRKGMEDLVQVGRKSGRANIAFTSAFLLQQVDTCVDILVETKRFPEAAFFARTYAPSRIAEVLRLWKVDLANVNQTAAEALADPVEHSDHEDFADLKIALSIEQMNMGSASKAISASNYFKVKEEMQRDLIAIVREGGSIESKVSSSSNNSSSSVNNSNNVVTEEVKQEEQPPAPQKVASPPKAAVEKEEEQDTATDDNNTEEANDDLEDDLDDMLAENDDDDDDDDFKDAAATTTTTTTTTVNDGGDDDTNDASNQEINLDDLDLDDEDWS